MCVVNDLDRLHLVGDVIDRLPQLGAAAAYFKQVLRDKLLDHHAYIRRWGDDLPEIKNWRWSGAAAGRTGKKKRGKADTAADNI
jgi:xylulose-5-phosphate/fructose-6-phosphate phosphoketolase